MSTRLFAALLPPEPVLAELAPVRDALRALPGADGMRWTERRNWHVTLAFYGDVDEAQRGGLSERLARAAARSRPLHLRLAGGGHFGGRALWAGLAPGDPDADPHPVEALRRLAQSANAAGRRVGLDLDDGRRFHAHLTLAHARPRRGPAARHRPDLPAYAAALDGFRGTPWTADAVALVRSELPASGVPGEQPHYEPVASWPLGG